MVFPIQSQSLARLKRCPRNRSGVLAVTFLQGAQGLLSRFVRVYPVPVFRLHHSKGAQGLLWRVGGGITRGRWRDCSRVLTLVYSGYITQGGAGVALAGWWWHHSRRRRESEGLLSRFDSCVFRLHHSRNTSEHFTRGRRGCSGGLLSSEPTAQVLLFPYTHTGTLPQ